MLALFARGARALSAVSAAGASRNKRAREQARIIGGERRAGCYSERAQGAAPGADAAARRRRRSAVATFYGFFPVEHVGSCGEATSGA